MCIETPESVMIKKIEDLIIRIPCQQTKDDLKILFSKLVKLHTPGVVWIVK